MATTKIVELKNLDAKQIKIHPLKEKKYKSGFSSKLCPFTWNNGDKIYIKTQKNRMPFKVTDSSKFMDDTDKEAVKNGKKFPKYSIELELKEDEKKSLEKCDKVIAAHILDNFKELFPNKRLTKKLTIDDIIDHNYYKGSIKRNTSEDGDYPDRMKIKLPFYNAEPNFKVYDENKNRIIFHEKVNDVVKLDWECMQPKSDIMGMVEVEGLVFGKDGYYLTFKAVQLKVHKPDIIANCVFDDDEEEENNNNDKKDKDSNKKDSNNKKDLQIDEDNEDNDEDNKDNDEDNKDNDEDNGDNEDEELDEEED